jgi:PIN domain nuclease of toxin-antitoxin system
VPIKQPGIEFRPMIANKDLQSAVDVLAADSLPLMHKDPFDRILVAQATVEGVTLLTIDSLVSQYPGPIRTV